jgi:hypothetical protein
MFVIRRKEVVKGVFVIRDVKGVFVIDSRGVEYI